MATCKECDDELDGDFVTLKVGRKKIKVCEDCADRLREEQEIAEASEDAMREMMGFKGRW